MKNLKKIVLLILFLTSNYFIAQTNTIFDSESIYLQTNSNSLIVGETLHFKINCINNSTQNLSNISKVAYIEIIDKNKKSISREKIKLENGIGSGEIFISSAFHSEYYKIIVYTNWMLNNFSNTFFEKNLLIINPFESNLTKEIENNSILVKIESQKNSSLIALNKSIYKKRDRVNVFLQDLKNEIDSANFSISVKKIDHLNHLFTNEEQKKQLFSNEILEEANIKFLPEIRGENVSGNIKLYEQDKSPKRVAFTIPTNPFTLKIVKADSIGNFTFYLDDFSTISNASFQILDNRKNDYIIELNKNSRPFLTNLEFPQMIKFSSNLLKDIKQRAIAIQIQKAYSETKLDSIHKLKKGNLLDQNIANEYILDDYKRFPTLKETVVEIIPAVYYKVKNEQFLLYVRDFITYGDTFGEALVLVDGLLIQNHQELESIDMKNVYKIEVINKAYTFGSQIFSGVISITTLNKNYVSNSEKIKTFILERCSLSAKSIEKSELIDSKLPDYRYQLLWNPKIILNPFDNSLTFFTSDIEGLFEITIEGISKNGNLICEKKYFQVQQ